MKLGFIGLGKMGSRMAEKLINEGHEVIAWNRSPEPAQQLKANVSNAQNVTIAADVKELVAKLSSPRIVILMLPAGEATENLLEELKGLVSPDDIVIDGSNSHYQETDKHQQQFNAISARFLGMGVSGGIVAVRNGYPMMVGGDRSAYEYAKPILDSLAVPHGGHEYFGSGGAGHFVKMVHNGIEYPIMQALGEGFGVLENSPYKLDLVKVARLYQKGTLVSGFMLDRALEALEDDTINQVEGIIGSASGEAVWTVEEAHKNDLPAEAIQQSIEFRRRSETDAAVQRSFAARMVGALRIKFGGHPVKKK